MPGSHYGDIHSKIWDLLEQKKEDEAREIYNRLLPLINLENLYGITIFKEVLVRRGDISGATVRSPGKMLLDKYDYEELKTLLESISNLFTWKI